MQVLKGPQVKVTKDGSVFQPEQEAGLQYDIMK